MQLNTYLTFKDNARDAMEFYARVLGGKLEIMTMGESPMAGEVPAEFHGAVMHACLQVGGGSLMASDCPPSCGVEFEGNKGFSLALGVETPAEVDRLFNALADGGRVTMPPGETFWSPRFGMLVDKFGIAWMINCVPAEGAAT